MIIIKSTMDCENGVIFNHEAVGTFSHSIRNELYQGKHSKSVFVWSGFGGQVSKDFFENHTWEHNFVRLFGNQALWPWKFKFSGAESDRIGNQDLIRAFRSDTTSNLIASLRIREFSSDDLFTGSIEWFEQIIPSLKDEHNGCMLLVTNIMESLRVAKEVGITLFLEKISIIVSHDNSNFITLTPHLHRDGAYGHLESAIVSFYSERITPNSSTLFFPDFDFAAASHLKPITAEKIVNHFPNASAYSVGSGSLAIFSGKLAKDGTKSDKRGALHISPEGFVPTRRLTLLFRSKISS